MMMPKPLFMSFYMLNFLQNHWLDITTTVLGLLYILLEVKASIWMWLVGFLMQSLGILLYYQKGLYADCGMEFYYLVPWLLGITALWMFIYWILLTFTNSNVPLADSFTTALSVVGIWALARKYLEQWYIWIAVDVVTCVLYFYKDIPFKASLYALYVVIAIIGVRNWKRKMQA